ncbi:MAG: helix-turn-helix domain-containing protein [Solirubrobacterales bacterium]
MEADSKSLQPFVGDVVRSLRHELGWSQEELADRAGLYSNQISLLERAERTITLPVLEKVAETLGVECDQVMWAARMIRRRVEREEAKKRE